MKYEPPTANMKRDVHAPIKYVCKKEDLDLLIDGDLRDAFADVFHRNGTWRIHYKNTTPNGFLQKFMNPDNPTVRDAVALDLVRLDDGSTSNDSPYTYREHVRYSHLEYERMLLHRNYRINLVNLEDEWSVV